MYLDAVHDQNGVLIFNTLPGHIVNILATMTEEARELYTVTRGHSLKTYSVRVYLDKWAKEEIG